MWKSKTWYFFLVSSLCYLILLLLFYITPEEGREAFFVPFLVIGQLFLVSLIFSIHTFVKVSRNKIISTEEGGEVTKKMTAKKYLFLILAIIAAIFVFFDFYIMLDYLLLSHLRFFLASIIDINSNIYLIKFFLLLFVIVPSVYAGVSVFRLRALPKLIIKILFTSIILFFLVITIDHYKSKDDIEYTVGHMYVTFKDTTSKKDIIDLVNSYNLIFLPTFEGDEIFTDFVVALGYKRPRLDKESEKKINDDVYRIKEKDKELNGEDFIINTVKTSLYSPQIKIKFKENTTEKSVEELLHNFEDFEIIFIYPPSLFFNVSVPVGEEKKWVKIFEKEDIVDDASLQDYSVFLKEDYVFMN